MAKKAGSADNGIGAALKALADASTELTKAVGDSLTDELAKQVVPQVTGALRQAAASMENATKHMPSKRSANTRAELLAAAAAVFAEKGIASASLEEIAKRAGRTKGAIYSQFASKEDLVTALVQQLAIDCSPEQLRKNTAGFLAGQEMEERIAGAISDSSQEFLLTLELLAYALRNPHQREEIVLSLQSSQDSLALALREQRHPEANGPLTRRDRDDALALECLVNMGTLYASLSTKLADPAAVTRSIERVLRDD